MAYVVLARLVENFFNRVDLIRKSTKFKHWIFVIKVYSIVEEAQERADAAESHAMEVVMKP